MRSSIRRQGSSQLQKFKVNALTGRDRVRTARASARDDEALQDARRDSFGQVRCSTVSRARRAGGDPGRVEANSRLEGKSDFADDCATLALAARRCAANGGLCLGTFEGVGGGDARVAAWG